MPPENGPPEPWNSFFTDLDKLTSEPVHLHCFGGFAAIHAYGVARTTNDCDFVSLIPHPLFKEVSALGGKGSELHRRHRVYLDPVTVATPPDRMRIGSSRSFRAFGDRSSSSPSKRRTWPSRS